MESSGEHKRDKSLLAYWMVVGLGLGLVIGASTHEMGLGLTAGLVMGALMAFFATKPGVDQ
jgi:hypothetical protein